MKNYLKLLAIFGISTSAFAARAPMEDFRVITNSPIVQQFVLDNRLNVKAIEATFAAACGANSPTGYKITANQYNEGTGWSTCTFGVMVSASDGQCMGTAPRVAGAPSNLICK